MKEEGESGTGRGERISLWLVGVLVSVTQDCQNMATLGRIFLEKYGLMRQRSSGALGEVEFLSEHSRKLGSQ